ARRAPLATALGREPQWTPNEAGETPNEARTKACLRPLIASTLGAVRPNGAAMKAIREARGISLQQLAKDIGRDVGFLSRVERDQQGAGDETLHRYAQRLNVPITAITHKEIPRDQEEPGTPERQHPH